MNRLTNVKKASAVLVATLVPVLLAAAMLSGAHRSGRPSRQETTPQEVQKPKYDYMSRFLSERSTQPLGLKEAPAVRQMMGQGPVKWSVRAGSRHILD